MSSARQDLLRLLATKSFRLGEFKLSSGGTSDYYIDCRATTLDARGAQLTGQAFLEEIRSRGWNAEAIEAARDFGFEVVGVMCLVEREEAGGRAGVENAAGAAPFVAVFTANEVRREHVALGTQHSVFR